MNLSRHQWHHSVASLPPQHFHVCLHGADVSLRTEVSCLEASNQEAAGRQTCLLLASVYGDRLIVGRLLSGVNTNPMSHHLMLFCYTSVGCWIPQWC